MPYITMHINLTILHQFYHASLINWTLKQATTYKFHVVKRDLKKLAIGCFILRSTKMLLNATFAKQCFKIKCLQLHLHSGI